MMARLAAKGLKPRLSINKTDGKWTLRTETIFKTMTIEFLPNVEFQETTGDGRELKVTLFSYTNKFTQCFIFQGIVQFENSKWIQKMRDKKGKEMLITRWVDENDQLQIVRYFSIFFF